MTDRFLFFLHHFHPLFVFRCINSIPIRKPIFHPCLITNLKNKKVVQLPTVLPPHFPQLRIPYMYILKVLYCAAPRRACRRRALRLLSLCCMKKKSNPWRCRKGKGRPKPFGVVLLYLLVGWKVRHAHSNARWSACHNAALRRTKKKAGKPTLSVLRLLPLLGAWLRLLRFGPLSGFYCQVRLAGSDSAMRCLVTLPSQMRRWNIQHLKITRATSSLIVFKEKKNRFYCARLLFSYSYIPCIPCIPYIYSFLCFTCFFLTPIAFRRTPPRLVAQLLGLLAWSDIKLLYCTSLAAWFWKFPFRFFVHRKKKAFPSVYICILNIYIYIFMKCYMIFISVYVHLFLFLFCIFWWKCVAFSSHSLLPVLCSAFSVFMPLRNSQTKQYLEGNIVIFVEEYFFITRDCFAFLVVAAIQIM